MDRESFPPDFAREHEWHNAQIERRARELLKRVLTEEQWDEYRTLGFVTLDTARFRYRIYPIGALMLDLRTGVQVAHTCLQFCSADPPVEDRMLAEYLLIRNDEERYLRTRECVLAPRHPRESVVRTSFGRRRQTKSSLRRQSVTLGLPKTWVLF